MVAALGWRECLEQACDGVVRGIDGSGTGLAQEMLELGEDLFACRGLLTAALPGFGSKACWPSMD
jgi:hypothetical protein